MAIMLTKGNPIDLRKSNGTPLTNVMIGLGWTSARCGDDIDLDSSVIMLDADGQTAGMEDVIYFGKLYSKNGSIKHDGDNLVGTDGVNDCERIHINLQALPPEAKRLVFILNIYACDRRNQTFGDIDLAYIRVVDENTGEESIRYNVTSESDFKNKTALFVAEVYQTNGEWKIVAIGEPTFDKKIADMVARYPTRRSPVNVRSSTTSPNVNTGTLSPIGTGARSSDLSPQQEATLNDATDAVVDSIGNKAKRFFRGVTSFLK